MMYTPREEDEQIAVVKWCDMLKIPVIHIPNEGKRSAQMGAKLKRMGLRLGVPDLLIPCARGGHSSASNFIAIKKRKAAKKEA